jgi:hypothetical protein
MKYLIVLVIMVACPILFAKGFMSSEIGIQDIKHKCDKGTLSCYALGLKTGQIAGTQMKQSGFLYSIVGGCNSQHSPNYCYGYLRGFDKGFGRPTTDTEIQRVGKSTGTDAASGNVTSSPSIACTVNALFCKSYLQGYQQSYAANIPYNAGYADGTKYAQHLIKICHVEKHPKIPGHHTSAYEKGWMTAYSDATGAANNDNGTYGNNCMKYY